MADLLGFERALWGRGVTLVAGVDEAGRGALFGPVVAAAVILDAEKDLSPYVDSKQLSEPRRESVFERLKADGHLYAVGVVSAEEIDATDILRATLRAMTLALDGLPVRPEHVLVDGPHLPVLPCDGEAVIHGDARSASVAAASIVAKVTRDRVIRSLDARYPGYGLRRNKGYGTVEHMGALRSLGPSPLHRRSFRGVVSGDA